ncbi:heme ABC exporter ATP-binding protein CcmA [Glacieibacterium sp.]|uniref:heme ABC exporter ATP-binding protein CcmA n=1 Tax=Glacieibacterium sp. TaxID=2860237 RepID=UPI003AFF8A90
MPAADAELIATDLACVRGGRTVFSGVSIHVRPGEALQVEGRNGAGKSSLLRILAGLLAPAGGILANGFTCAWLGAEATLKAGRSLRSELLYWASLDNQGPDSVDSALAAFDLAPLADLPVEILSSGQRRRAALARVHASAARLWLLDEPAVGLDTASLHRLAQAVHIHRSTGGAVIVATHGDIGLDAPARLVLS